MVSLGFRCDCGEIGHEAVLMGAYDGSGVGIQWKTGMIARKQDGRRIRDDRRMKRGSGRVLHHSTQNIRAVSKDTGNIC